MARQVQTLSVAAYVLSLFLAVAAMRLSFEVTGFGDINVDMSQSSAVGIALDVAGAIAVYASVVLLAGFLYARIAPTHVRSA